MRISRPTLAVAPAPPCGKGRKKACKRNAAVKQDANVYAQPYLHARSGSARSGLQKVP